MPVLRNRYDNVKIWRPSGTPYAEASGKLHGIDGVDRLNIGITVEHALIAFQKEFGRFPERSRTVIEVACGTATIYAAVYELPFSRRTEWKKCLPH